MISYDFAIQCLTLGSVALFGGVAVFALGWSFQNGQFDNFQRGSQSSFGSDEPVGQPTDAFPTSTQGR